MSGVHRRRSDPDSNYGDPTDENEGLNEAMHSGCARLAKLRREGFAIGKTCAEMPSDIICPPGMSAVDILSDWGVKLERPGKTRGFFSELRATQKVGKKLTIQTQNP